MFMFQHKHGDFFIPKTHPPIPFIFPLIPFAKTITLKNIHICNTKTTVLRQSEFRSW